MKKTLIIAMVLIATINTKAQEKIKGRVVELMEDGNETPIPGANVYWEGTTIGVASDEEGFYLIPEPVSYPATMVVSFVGYQAYTQVIKENSHYHIVLSPSVELDEVKVKGKVNTTKFSTINAINMQTLSTGELEKAACCNLSESFSTNATVDVTFSDAVSGAKQIQMLGLDGMYTQITQENMPLIRGISSAYGLSYVPGTWIESIQIIKGSGSVINGFESFAGQINLEYYKPESAPKLFWNMYTNQEGKIENNLLLAKKSGNWKSNLFTHISYFDKEIDHNKDNFLDVPTVTQLNALNRWKYEGKDNYRMSFTVRGLVEDRVGGTVKNADSSYVVDIHNDLLEFTSKTGVINSPGKSAGLQTSFRRHNQTAVFGKNNYKGLQESAYLNLIRQTYLGNTDHKLKYGISYYADRYTESFSGNINNAFTDKVRMDLMSGLFSEYNYSWGESFNLTAGLRADYYNNTEQLNYLPRLNMKYNPTEDMAIRFSAGKAFRIANVFVENASFLASNRMISLEELNPEIAWNYGMNITYCFRLFGREGTINADAYRTEFKNQIVVDIEKQDSLSFYNLEDGGVSYANSMQLDLAYELFNRFDVKMAYKINDVKSTFGADLKSAPLTPENRALLNFSYATNFDKWMFDVTANYIGKSRIPSHSEINDDFSKPFKLYNAQITKKFNYFDVYLGAENLEGKTQENPILSANSPNSSNFDASLIYAPINGRMIYAGFRYKIK
ncbi:MAG TPA: TonB-dependent receptor [Alphaproteobacteria bacterium]|nr:TonB-dependent receptor [Alphaproteobacteria bacterium]